METGDFSSIECRLRKKIFVQAKPVGIFWRFSFLEIFLDGRWRMANTLGY